MESNARPVRAARFGPFQVDFRAGELKKDGRRIRLQDQPLQILALLVENPGQVVTREELQQKLWPGDTFVDFDHGLNNAINRLREALNDSAESPRYIETLPRRGYRFIATVEKEGPAVAAAETANGASSAEAPVQATPPVTWRARGALATLFLVVVAAIVWSVAAHKGPAAIGSAAVPSGAVAVLPFSSLSNDPSHAYLADAFNDALTTELALIQGLHVTSRFSTMQYKDKPKPLPEIARELGVSAVIEATVRREGQRLFVNAQLIDAARDRHLWARQYERDIRDLPILQREVARDVARELGVPLSETEKQRLARAQPVNSEAFEYYWKGRLRYLRQGPEDNRIAIEMLEQAVALDPSFAEAHATLATAYCIRAFNIEPRGRQRPWEEKAFVSLEKAKTLDADLPDIYIAEGIYLWSPVNGFAHEKAIQVYRRALQLNPNVAEAHHQIGNIYNHIGLFDRSSMEVEKAIELEPLNHGARFRTGIALLYQGKFEQALRAFETLGSQGFNPSLWGFQTSFALFQLGRKEEAAQRVEEFLRKDPKDPGGSLTSLQALLAAAEGNTRRTEQKIQEAIRIGDGYQHFHHTTYVIASAYALLNRPEPALKFLQRTADEGFPCYPLFELDPNLKNLRGDPRFVEFMAQQKKQWEYFRSKL